MGKDPAFLLYSKDILTSMLTLNWEDRGKLITIICLMHQQGRLKEETIRLLVGSVSDSLREKFTIDKDGLWFSPRLEEETAKRNKFVESRQENGAKGGRPKGKTTKKKLTVTKKEPVASATGNHTGDADANGNADAKPEEKPKRKREKKAPHDLVFPYDSPEFMKAWDTYINMRIQKGKPLKTQTGIQAKLKFLSKYDEQIATMVLMQSAENEWQDLYPLKNEYITKHSAANFIGESIGISREETLERLSSYANNKGGAGSNTGN